MKLPYVSVSALQIQLARKFSPEKKYTVRWPYLELIGTLF